ncbi:MAG: glycoside hydrolase, partial [Clostridia bacterium]|nr:glycoside hydrolase [Clostridia bacterium]
MKQVEKKYRSVPFWSWNDELDKEKLIKQIEWMNENGVGGFFMHARGGLKTPYLGEKWHECIEACAKRAQELGMEAYAYDENGWPSGFVGGKLLEDIENHDKYLTHKIGIYDENALASYDISGETLKRVFAPCDNCLNVYEHYSVSTADILNPSVVDKFLDLTHKEYKKRDKYDLKGFFTDEPQYYRWDTPYTKVLPEYFKKNYNEDILNGLGHLFVEKEGYRSFRYKYWKAMQALMLESFGKKIYDWCDENGYKLTGHYIEEGCLDGQMLCCAGIMPFYEYEHIPGIDYLGSWISKGFAERQVVSVSAQLGKNQILTETFAGCGWDI